MTRSVLLATSAMIALLASNAAPAQRMSALAAPPTSKVQHPLKNPKKVLYNQNSNDAGSNVDSYCFTSTGTPPACFTAGADDFVIPSGKHWKIGEVDVTGVYMNSDGSTASSANVIFYQDSNGFPGNPVANGTYNNLKCGGMGTGDFRCHLKPKKLRLGAGHYWVSVQANINGNTQWGWEMNSVVQNDSAVKGTCGAGCWERVFNDDLMFELQT